MTHKYNDVTATLALAKASFRSILRSPSSVIFTLVFPLVFILIFGLIVNGGVKLHVGMRQQADMNNPVIKELQKVKAIKFEYFTDTAQMADKLRKGHLDADLEVVNNPSGQPPYITNVVFTSASQTNGRILMALLNDAVQHINTTVTQPAVTVLNTATVKGREYKTIDFILPGQLGFSLLSSGIFATAFVFFNLRQNLVIKRFFTTPVKRWSIILGEAIARISFSLLGSLMLILVGHYFFGFTLYHGAVTVLNMLLLSLLGLVVFMGMGFAISGVAKSESTIPPISNIFTLPQFLLSGTFFSTEVFPAWLQPVSKVLPLTFLNDALRKISFEGASLWGVRTELGALLLWGIVVYIVAVKTFKWE